LCFLWLTLGLPPRLSGAAENARFINLILLEEGFIPEPVPEAEAGKRRSSIPVRPERCCECGCARAPGRHWRLPAVVLEKGKGEGGKPPPL